VDFVPFRPGNGVSIYEFFQPFEDWSRGQMSQDHKANVLFNRHLDFSVTDGNKELEDAKGNYPAMKSLLTEKWGTCDLVCDQYLEGIRKVAMPADPRDKTGMLVYVKNAYGKLVTLTKLEAERGQPVPGLADYYLSNCFLRKVHRLLPDDLGSEFLMKLQENGENYYLMKGREYMDRIISMLRWSYKSLEIMLDEPGIALKVTDAVADVHSYASSSSGDDQPNPPSRPKRWKKQRTKPSPLDTAMGAGDSATSVHHTSGHWEKATRSNLVAGLAAAQEAARAPRWACPVNGHSGHTLDKCRDFWEATSCTERGNMLADSSCFTCLGRDQGCSNGTCAIISEVPPETVCQGCAKSSRAEQPPPNVLCCGLPFHKKPPTGDIVAAMERFVPGLRAAKFGMTPEVNVVRAEPVSTVERACVPSTPNWAYNTQTGTTKKVEAKDRVLTTSNQCACYIMQQLNIAGERALIFYDSGANNNLVEFELAQDADFQLLSSNSVSFKVAGGGSVKTDRGQFSAILGPDVNGDYQDLECQAVDRITGEFPVFLLRDAIKEANAAIGEGHVFPPEIGGTHVRLLIGIRNTQLAPMLRLVLPSGLCLYDSKFRDVYGSTLCFGGPHGVFTEGYAAAGMFASADVMQICFTEIASASTRREHSWKIVPGPTATRPSRSRRSKCSGTPRPESTLWEMMTLNYGKTWTGSWHQVQLHRASIWIRI
jgi:hypothetical protein